MRAWRRCTLYSLLPCQRPAPPRSNLVAWACTNLAAATSIQRQRAWHAETESSACRHVDGGAPSPYLYSAWCIASWAELGRHLESIHSRCLRPVRNLQPLTLYIMVRALTTTALFASPLAEARPQLLQLAQFVTEDLC